MPPGGWAYCLMFPRAHCLIAGLALACAGAAPVHAEEFRTFSSEGLPGSQGVVVRVKHPAHWRKVALEDELALAELRGTQGRVTGILQVGRGRRQHDMEALCRPERARTMLQDMSAQEPGTRVTDVVARRVDGRPAFELRYERSDAPGFLLVRSVIVCLKDSRLVVSCAAAGEQRAALAEIEPVCRQVLESVTVAEE